MDLRYFKYVNSTNPYYTKPTIPNKKSALYISDIPNNYDVREEEHWTNVINIKNKLPIQGWKIHISTTIDFARKTLETVSNMLFEHEISFKYVKSIWELSMKNSKYGDRSSAGKFITIYPPNEDVFLKLLEMLRIALISFPKGPYILTDKRWYESNVFFRYGAFLNMYFYKDNKKVYAIKNPKGELIEDLRAPHYFLPEFVKEPVPIQNMDRELDNETVKSSPLDDIEVINAIHYSNGGGVYLANDRQGNKIILKEGRPNIGIDSLGKDAFTRISNEAKVLKKLNRLQHPVKIYDFFEVWEHNFIKEEYIDGPSLNLWVGKRYPFYENSSNKKYLESTINILNQLIDALNEMHNCGIGMGDLQPSNIIITPEENIRLIDFETASSSDDSVPSGLITHGFTGKPNMTRKQADWFALLRIARFLFVPIGPVHDISSKILAMHDKHIEKYFGNDAIKIILKIQKKCSLVKAYPSKDLLKYSNNPNGKVTLHEMKRLLQNNIVNNLFTDNRLIPGDIRQYELKSGLLNTLSGGFGAVLALNRTGVMNDKINKWIDSQDLDSILNTESGLLTGRAGIATGLWESGYYEKAKHIFNSLNESENSSDITLSSGLSGIGLALLGLSYENKFFTDYLNRSIKIANKLEVLLENDISIVPYDMDIIPRGLMNGWSGVSLFYSSLYKRTKDSKWLDLSRKAIEKDLLMGQFDEDGVYQLDDIYRVVPYLDGGSAGVGLALIELSLHLKEDLWKDELNGIYKLSRSKCFFNCGLFRGTSGIIAVSNAIDKYYNRSLHTELFESLDLHIFKATEEIYTPGDSGLRLSNDLFSGSSGLLLVVNDAIKNSTFSWLPVMNIDKVFESNSLRSTVKLVGSEK